MQVRYAKTLDLPELQPYGTLRQHEEHRREGIFVAEGDKVVRRLLESDFGVVSVLLPERRLKEFEPLVLGRPEDIPVYVVEIAELEKLTGFPFFQGVLAVGRIPRCHTLPSVITAAPRPILIVAIDGLTNSENVGLVVRNAAAFGAHAVMVDSTSASPFLRRAVRNSMGAIFKLPIIESPNLAASLRDLESAGIPSFAAHPHASGSTIDDAPLGSDCCIVLGSEGLGISQPVLDACRRAVAIPMRNDIDSLNVGSAAAVFLYEAYRQRRPNQS